MDWRVDIVECIKRIVHTRRIRTMNEVKEKPVDEKYELNVHPHGNQPSTLKATTELGMETHIMIQISRRN